MNRYDQNSPNLINTCRMCGTTRLGRNETLCNSCYSKKLKEKREKEKQKEIQEKVALYMKCRPTKRQKEILEYYSRGLNMTETAERLGISRQCVSSEFGILKRKAENGDTTERKNEINEERRIRASYERLGSPVKYELYSNIYRKAAKKDPSAAIITKRVLKQLNGEEADEKKIDELIDSAVYDLTFTREKKHTKRK